MHKVFNKVSSFFVASLFAASSFLGSATPLSVYAADTVNIKACSSLHNGGAACTTGTAGGKWYVTFSQNGDWGNNQDFHYKVYMNGGGQRLYCIQPLRNIINGTANYSPQVLGEYLGSQEKLERLQLITTLGYGFNGDTSEEMDYATQIRIWQELGYTLTYIHPEIQAKVDQINERLRIASTPVDFGTTSITLKGYGKENAITLTDKNGVFQHYKDAKVEGMHYEHNGNNLTIWAEKGDSLSTVFRFDCYWLQEQATAGNPIAYASSSSQDVARIEGTPDPRVVGMSIKLLPTGDISINKKIAYQDAVDKSLLKDQNITVNGIGFSIVAKTDVTKNDGTVVKAGERMTGLTVSNGVETNKDGIYYIQKNDEQSVMTISEIPIGSYELVETVSHDGLATNTVTYPFTITEQGTTKWETTFDAIVNQPTEYEIKKTNTDNEIIAGAEMQILDADNNVVDAWTSTTQPHTIEGLKPGQYVLHEAKAPDGYVAADDVSFEVLDTGEVQATGMVDIVQRVDKVDQFDRLVSGATLTVKDETGTTVDQWITGRNVTDISEETLNEVFESGYATWDGNMNIVPYQYIAKETEDSSSDETTDETTDESAKKTKEGTPEETTEDSTDITPTIDDTYTFTLTPNWEEEMVDEISETPEINDNTSEIDTKNTTNVLEESKNTLEQAKTILETMSDNKEISEEDYQKISELIQEVEKLLGAEDESAIQEKMVELQDQFEALGVTIGGQSDAETQTNKSEFVLEARNNTTGKTYYFDVDAQGNETSHRVNNVKVGNTYTLEETTAPNKYVQAESIEFTVEDNGEDQIVSMTDVLTDEVAITKKDATDKDELPGAHLKVTDKDGNIVEEWVSTDEAHIIKGLIVGEEYTLTETAAPNGYNFAESITFKIDDNGAVLQHVEMFDTRKPKVQTGLFGSDKTPWIVGGCAVLVIGAVVVILLRRRSE